MPKMLGGHPSGRSHFRLEAPVHLPHYTRLYCQGMDFP